MKLKQLRHTAVLAYKVTRATLTFNAEVIFPTQNFIIFFQLL
jgi:hypothetical protein